MGKEHRYAIDVEWTGNTGVGTANYQSYSRDHVIRSAGKPPIEGSSDPNFRGEPGRWNPEELLVAALSACHKLWYLHLCSAAGIVVVRYRDAAEGVMIEESATGGRFSRVILKPVVQISAGDLSRAEELHHQAHAMCFIANSVNFPVECEPTVSIEGAEPAVQSRS